MENKKAAQEPGRLFAGSARCCSSGMKPIMHILEGTL
jgi:hypothetical protein